MLRPGRTGDELRSGPDVALSPHRSIFLVHSGFSGGGRADHRDASTGWILSMGPRRVWRFLGISRWLVELDRIVSFGQRLRRAVYGLSGVLFSTNHRLETLSRLHRAGCGDYVYQRAWNQNGGARVDRAGDTYFSADPDDDGDRPGAL